MSQSVNSRIDQSTHGTPKLNPDEQRKYLGTFRERVSLAIPIRDLEKPQATVAVKKEMQAHPNYQLIINGRINRQLTTPYLSLASQLNVKFTIKTDSFYFTKPDSYGVIYANPHQAINQYPIELNAKYPAKKATPKSQKGQAPHHHKIRAWLRNLF